MIYGALLFSKRSDCVFVFNSCDKNGVIVDMKEFCGNVAFSISSDCIL